MKPANPTEWELSTTRSLSGSENMALDSAGLEDNDAGYRVRIYSWSPPALSVGIHARIDQGVIDRCRTRGVEVIRRSTGGGAVLHDGDVTYSVSGPDPGLSTLDLYALISRPLIAGLRMLGVTATVERHPFTAIPLACFAQQSGADIGVRGRKIVGSAQVRRNGRFLQHGSLPVSDSRPLTRELLGHSDEDKSTYLARLVPGIAWDGAAEALIAGFSAEWGSPKLSTFALG